ncbi:MULTISPECIES: YicC/YloC family endoribonuclease [Kangiella]|uniref:YicC family protein n=2 Tax=Kangiella TaxID=261963 RepID=A0A318D4F0_9GAMM|nr:YicC/YloC family endoribonuclease [Kangiella spongicola]MBV34901.1 YicC family protein [Rickettsiales bacterium]PXF64130.1 YicC family protein [Kangiella spongicola]
MLKSMTAFARQQFAAEWGNVTWEIKSVNQRFLEPNFRMPESFRHLEFELRNVLRKRLNRGKLDCTLRIEMNPKHAGRMKLDQEMAQQLLTAHEELQVLAQDNQSADLVQLMRWPGLLQQEETDTNTMEKDVKQAFSQAVDQLIEVRQREGEALAATIEQRLKGISEEVAKVQQQMPDVIKWQRERIINRFEEAKVELDQERLEQEMVFLAQKVDVAEEIDRLNTHVTECLRLIKDKGPVGRRLDFLMQEFNREANTLGSKSINADITNSSVEIKVLIEQMREQVQNIE